MRGMKGWEYDGGHRVPFFLHWPAGRFAEGRDVARLTSHIDILPTLAELCGASVRVPARVHGTSLVPLLRDPDASWEDRTIVTDSQRVSHPIKWRKSATMTGRWRLVNGKELFDIRADPEQRRDLAEAHPDVVAQLRADYEKWWELVSARFDEEIPIVVGSDAEPEPRLSSHDWHTGEVRPGSGEAGCPWNQAQVRQGMAATGHWAIDVERAGTYRVELRRWPREVPSKLTEGVGEEPPLPEGIDPGARGWYLGGKALALRTGHVRAGTTERTAPLGKTDDAVVFEVDLPAGRTSLEAWFVDAEGAEVGAYYVHVRVVDR
jgi:arylsulfatase B